MLEITQTTIAGRILYQLWYGRPEPLHFYNLTRAMKRLADMRKERNADAIN